jgi:hypothetical protein
LSKVAVITTLPGGGGAGVHPVVGGAVLVVVVMVVVGDGGNTGGGGGGGGDGASAAAALHRQWSALPAWFVPTVVSPKAALLHVDVPAAPFVQSFFRPMITVPPTHVHRPPSVAHFE